MKKRKYSNKKSKILRKRRKKSGFFSKFYFPIIGAFLFATVALFGLFYMSSQFDIKNIKVGGMNNIPEEELIKLIKEKLTLSYSIFDKEIIIENFLLPNSKKISSVLDSFPQIESVDVKRDFKTGTIYFEIKEKTPTAVWIENFSQNNKCFLIDDNGTFIESCDNENIKGLILVEENKDVCEKDKQNRKDILIAVEKILKQVAKLNLSVKNFSVLSIDKLVLNLNQGCEIFFNPKDDLDWELKKLETVLKQDKYSKNLNNLEYIDVRFGNQAVIK
ncbi:MAG: cell division protein FtsQ/DivIB [Candidatus Paceibacterota bacterium]|jgi:cell division septal protein FtsQ